MDEPQPELNNQPVMPQEPAPMLGLIPPKHFSPKFIIALVVIILLAGASYGAIWWWGNQNSQVAIPSSVPISTLNQNPTPTLTKNPSTPPTSTVDTSTGILTGHVTVGPNCATQSTNIPCTPTPQVYTSRQVAVFPQLSQGPYESSQSIAHQYIDASGNYRLILPPGTYELHASGYAGLSQLTVFISAFTIKSGQTVTLNFNLSGHSLYPTTTP